MLRRGAVVWDGGAVVATVGRGGSLLRALAPPVVAMGYLWWRKGGALPASMAFWTLIAAIVVPEIGASLAGDRLRRNGRELAAGLVGFAGLAWLVGGTALLAKKARRRERRSRELPPLTPPNGVET